MEHEHNQIIDNDGYFEVNATTRAIVNKTREKISIMQYDHNSECFTFKIPRYIENHDMLKCNAVEVHFKNGINADVYTVTDLRECPEDKNKIICSWLISDYATQYADFLIFSLKFKCVEEDGAVSYLWRDGKWEDNDSGCDDVCVVWEKQRWNARSIGSNALQAK